MTHLPVVMYSTAVCPYCIRAEQLLRTRGVVDLKKIRIDLDPDKWEELTQRIPCRSVPQIFIGNTHVGGCDDLIALDQSGQLLPLLSGKTA